MKIKSFEFSKNAQKHSITYGSAIATHITYETIDDVRTKMIRVTLWIEGKIRTTNKTEWNENEASLTFGET